jgi:glycine dehydrogenase subunit 2
MEPRNLRAPEPLLFEVSRPGRRGFDLPALDVPEADRHALDGRYTRDDIEGFPELSEVEVTRHYTRLSRLNYAIDLGLYPLGSCTMKYNPKVNEKLARLPGFADAHPHLPEESVQGCLGVMHVLEKALCAICGMDRFTLQPAAGAQGEQVGMMMVRAYHRKRGHPRQVVLIPDSAHGTNPASAHLAGYRVEQIASNERGCIDVGALRRRVGNDVAVLMLTNPNPLGVFEGEIEEHKTFSTPHGGGGPGSGPVGVGKLLEPFLPVPTIETSDGSSCRLSYDRPASIGRVRSFFGNFGMHVRALAYILTHGPGGLRSVAEGAVLNANYIRHKLAGIYHLPYDAPTMHEVVFSDRRLEETGVRTLDVAKRLMDYGFHPPTIYFPLIVRGALMIEPTETESREELDAFIAAMRAIDAEARRDPDLVRSAPHTTPIRRLDEVAAARHPVLRWTPRNRQSS